MQPKKPIHLPWNQYARYWICVWPIAGSPTQASANALVSLGFQKRTADRDYYICLTGQAWSVLWEQVFPLLEDSGAEVEVAVIANDAEPDDKQISFSHKPVQTIHSIAAHLWLGEAILENRVVSYKQRVMSAKDKAVGHEAFARVEAKDGSVITGHAIVEAARALGIEFALDRYLHVLAIKRYVQANLDGFLFINFFPGFIQRPEVYLEGLNEAVRMHGVLPKHIVLDFTEIETQQDLHHLGKVTRYCREKGYAIALDDVSLPATMKKLIPEIRPDFIKLDHNLCQHYKRAQDADLLIDIVSQAHAAGAAVVAEGVETDEAFAALRQYEVDLFQGYLFEAPSKM